MNKSLQWYRQEEQQNREEGEAAERKLDEGKEKEMLGVWRTGWTWMGK